MQGAHQNGSNSLLRQEVEVDYGHHRNGGHTPLGHEPQLQVRVYPKGEVDAVTITDRDMEGLQPGRFLSGNIIDFYIKYLQRTRLPFDNKDRYYFFNSFFFTKLVASSSASGDTDEGKAAFEQVRTWSGDVDLFEKELIFIPVNQNLHWSLIIICNLGGIIGNLSSELRGLPWLLHLDSYEGYHNGTATHIWNYIKQAWVDKCQAPIDQLSAMQFVQLSAMHFVQVQVPQQLNSYDCGIYLLHYVELILLKTGSNTNLLNHVKRNWFEPEEVSTKRMFIQNLILEHSELVHDPANRMTLQGKDVSGEDFEVVQDEDTKRLDAQCTSKEHQPPGEPMVHDQQHEGLPFTSLLEPRKGKRKRNTDWTNEETSILVRCKMEAAGDSGSRFWKGKPDVTDWNVIAEEIQNKLGTGSAPKTGDQCRRRWDTLVKSYRKIKDYCTMNQKQYSGLTEKDWDQLELATKLCEGWFEVIDQFCPPKSRKGKIQLIDNVHCSAEPPLLSLHNQLHYIRPVQIETGSIEPRESYREEVDLKQDFLGISTTHEDLNPETPGLRVQVNFGSIALPESSGEAVTFGIWSTANSHMPAQLGIETRAPPESSGKDDDVVEAASGDRSANGDLNPVGSGPPQQPKSYGKQVAIAGFSSMSRDLQFTLANLVQAWPTFGCFHEYNGIDFFPVDLESVCRWLAIVQDRTPSATYAYVLSLLRRNLVTISTPRGETCRLRIADLRLYKKFIKMVVCRNRDLDIHSRIILDRSMRSLESSSLPQRIRVLTLYKCRELERVDVGKLPMLRSLSMNGCGKVKEVCGWENVCELGWLQIADCGLYCEYPKVHLLPSLRVVQLKFEDCVIRGPKPDFSQCVGLHTLRIEDDEELKGSWDVSTLKGLKHLSFSWCISLESIVGLSEVHGLSTLSLGGCGALKRVPDLGQLRALTELDLSRSGVEEIAGVENLHSLCVLDLFWCRALRRLPYLGHLRALAHLDIGDSGVEEIPGVGEMVSLKRLSCIGSRLKWLPELGHLPRLEWVRLNGTPVTEVESSKYFGKGLVEFSEKGKRADEVDDMGDSDSDDIHSDDDEQSSESDGWSLVDGA